MHISREKLDITALLRESHDPRAGAVVLFSGEARNHNHGKEVASLEFEVYEAMAEKKIAEIVSDARERWNLHYAHCVHKVGPVEISESCVVVLTSSSHRDEAYAANRYIIDRVKDEAPIWKKERFIDGGHEWVMQCHHGASHAAEQIVPG